jgi:hypothetical protein
MEGPINCPFCDQPMQCGYFLIGGGIWFSEASKPSTGPRIVGAADVLVPPIHVIVAAKGFNLDPENWPKPGFFCEKCVAVTFSPRTGQ